jgi:hypothetical protein
LAWFPRAVCAGELADGRELPKPAGGRPRSLVFPWASHVRVLLPGRCEELLTAAPTDARFEFVIAEGGRFCESCCCREVMPDELGALLGRLLIVDEPPGRLFVAGALLPGRLLVVGALLGWLFIVGAPPGRLFVAGALLPARLFIVGALCDEAFGATAC